MILTKDGQILTKDGQILTSSESGGLESAVEVVVSGRMTIGSSSFDASSPYNSLVGILNTYLYQAEKKPKLMRMKLEINGNEFGNGVYFEEFFITSTSVLYATQTRKDSAGNSYSLQIVPYGGINLSVYKNLASGSYIFFVVRTYQVDNGNIEAYDTDGNKVMVGSVVSDVSILELIFIY